MTLPRLVDDERSSESLRHLLANARTVPIMSPELNRQLSRYAAELTTATVGTTALIVSSAHVTPKGSLVSKAVATFLSAQVKSQVSFVVALLVASTAISYVISAPLVTPAQKATITVSTVAVTTRKTPSIKTDIVATATSAVPVESIPSVVKPPTTSMPRTLIPVESIEDGETTLSRETKMLELARVVLESNPTQSLAIAEEHAQRFPNGQLLAERELIAVDALLRLGRREEAIKRAAPRLADAPESLYVKRLRQQLDTTANAK